jgi:uncharacterized membrane protein
VLQPECPASPTAPVYGAGQTYGFNDNAFGSPEIPRRTFLDKLQDAGGKYIRSTISWQWYEPQPGVYNESYWSFYDRNYADMQARGVRPVIILIGTPYWALTPAGRGATSPDGSSFRCDGTNAACVAPPDVDRPDVRLAWQSFVGKVVHRYPNAAAVEVWNEPNIRWFWLQAQDPALYGRLLAVTATAVHQAKPTMVVLNGSLANYFGSDTYENTAADSFLRTVYTVGGKASFDAIGWHSYPCNYPNEPRTSQLQRDIKRVRAVRNAFHDNATKLWMTEVGVTTSGGSQSNCGGGEFSEKQQARILGDVLDWTKWQNAHYHDLPVVLIHTMMNSESRASITMANSNAQAEYGIVAYSYHATTKQTTIQNKRAYPVVRCKIHGTC